MSAFAACYPHNPLCAHLSLPGLQDLTVLSAASHLLLPATSTLTALTRACIQLRNPPPRPPQCQLLCAHSSFLASRRICCHASNTSAHITCNTHHLPSAHAPPHRPTRPYGPKRSLTPAAASHKRSYSPHTRLHTAQGPATDRAQAAAPTPTAAQAGSDCGLDGWG
jgi:hypothetical protein